MDKCWVCQTEFGDGAGQVQYQTLKNKHWLAKLDDAGNVIAECCEQCALDAEDDIDLLEGGIP